MMLVCACKTKSVSDDVFIFKEKKRLLWWQKHYFKMRIFWHVVGWFAVICCPRNSDRNSQVKSDFSWGFFFSLSFCSFRESRWYSPLAAISVPVWWQHITYRKRPRHILLKSSHVSDAGDLDCKKSKFRVVIERTIIVQTSLPKIVVVWVSNQRSRSCR